MIGSVLMDRYRLEELIGEGGMAEVYIGHLTCAPGTGWR